MAFNYMIPVRVFQGILAILVVALTAFVANWYNTFTLTPSPPQINFLVFCGVWTAVVAIPLLTVGPRFLTQTAHRYGMIAAEAVSFLFWFGGFVALGAFLAKLLFCRGNVCRAAQAATVFGAFECAMFLATTILAIIQTLRTRITPGGIEKTSQMTQV